MSHNNDNIEKWKFCNSIEELDRFSHYKWRGVNLLVHNIIWQWIYNRSVENDASIEWMYQSLIETLDELRKIQKERQRVFLKTSFSGASNSRRSSATNRSFRRSSRSATSRRFLSTEF